MNSISQIMEHNRNFVEKKNMKPISPINSHRRK